jgi:hypothetical protein
MAEDQLNCGSIPVRGSQAVECDRRVCLVDMCSDRFCGVCNLSTARACHNALFVLHMACMLAGVSFLLHVAACMQRRAALRFGCMRSSKPWETSVIRQNSGLRTLNPILCTFASLATHAHCNCADFYVSKCRFLRKMKITRRIAKAAAIEFVMQLHML